MANKNHTNRVHAKKKKKMLLSSRTKHHGRLILTGLIAIVLLCSLALSGCMVSSKSKDSSAEAQVEDGIFTLDAVTLDFGDNDVDDDTETTVTVTTPDEDEAPDGLASDLFEIDMEEEYTEPVTVSIPYDGEAPVDDDEAELMMGIGTTIEMDDGETDTFYQYISVDYDDGIATAEFTPSDYTEMTVRGDSNTGSSAPYKERTSFALFWVTSTYIDGGHFKVYMPLQANTFFLDYNERSALLDDLETVYNDYIAKGYAYAKRSEWPMNVTIKNLKTLSDYWNSQSGALGYYSYGSDGAQGQIYLNRDQFENGYTAGAMLPLLAHEFFHFVQLNYVDVGDDLLWFDEATSTYFESEKQGGVPSIVNEYHEKIFSGVYPTDNTAANGYCRMPLIAFLAYRVGEDFILNAYTTAGSGADWDSAILSTVGPTSGWAADFYQSLISGDVSNYSPYIIFNNLITYSEPELGTELKLLMPDEDEIASLEDGEPVLLGKTTLSVGSYGAKVVALTIDTENLDKLPDGVDPVVKLSGGGDLRVFAILGKSYQVATDSGDGIDLKDFKNALGTNHRFLVLVTGLHADDVQDYELTVEVNPYPTLDELVGTYTDGNLTYTEVYVSEALKAEAAADEVVEDTESEDDLGCDLNLDIIAALEAMEGQSQPVTIIISKTGENTGTLIWLEDGDEDNTPLPFTYENGKLAFDYESEGAVITDYLTAAYGQNKTVTLDGTLTISFTEMQDDFWIKMQLTGSKPLETTSNAA